MQNQTQAQNKSGAFNLNQLVAKSAVVYTDQEPVANRDLLEEFQKNLNELEDAVGRLKITMRDVRFHMKVE